MAIKQKQLAIIKFEKKNLRFPSNQGREFLPLEKREQTSRKIAAQTEGG